MEFKNEKVPSAKKKLTRVRCGVYSEGEIGHRAEGAGNDVSLIGMDETVLVYAARIVAPPLPGGTFGDLELWA